MDNRYESRNGNLIFKAERDVRCQGEEGNSQVQDGILRHFGADDGAYRFRPFYVPTAELRRQCIGDGFTFVRRKVTHANHDVFRRILIRNARQLNDTVFNAKV